MRSTINRPAPQTLRRAIRAAVLAMPLAALQPALIGQAHAAEAEQSLRSYASAAGPLSSALSQFAGEAEILLAVDGQLTAGKQSPGLQGQYSVEEGLAQLLQGSGLQVCLPRVCLRLCLCFLCCERSCHDRHFFYLPRQPAYGPCRLAGGFAQWGHQIGAVVHH